MAVDIVDFSFKHRDAVLAMARAMHNESPRYKDIPFSLERAGLIVELALTRHDIHCVVAEEDGLAIGMFVVTLSHYFFSDYIYAADMLMYVDQNHRSVAVAIKLIRAAEEWARAAGAHEARFANSAGISRAVDALYRRAGYAPESTGYVKRLGDV